MWEHSGHFRRQVADVSSNMDLYTQESVDMNAKNSQTNAPFLETVQPEFSPFYYVSPKSCTGRMGRFSWDSLVFFVACHPSPFETKYVCHFPGCS